MHSLHSLKLCFHPMTRCSEFVYHCLGQQSGVSDWPTGAEQLVSAAALRRCCWMIGRRVQASLLGTGLITPKFGSYEMSHIPNTHLSLVYGRPRWFCDITDIYISSQTIIILLHRCRCSGSTCQKSTLWKAVFFCTVKFHSPEVVDTDTGGAGNTPWVWWYTGSEDHKGNGSAGITVLPRHLQLGATQLWFSTNARRPWCGCLDRWIIVLPQTQGNETNTPTIFGLISLGK